MPFKAHILDDRLYKFKENMEPYSEELAEHFILGLIRENKLQYERKSQKNLITSEFFMVPHV